MKFSHESYKTCLDWIFQKKPRRAIKNLTQLFPQAESPVNYKYPKITFSTEQNYIFYIMWILLHWSIKSRTTHYTPDTHGLCLWYIINDHIIGFLLLISNVHIIGGGVDCNYFLYCTHWNLQQCIIFYVLIICFECKIIISKVTRKHIME